MPVGVLSTESKQDDVVGLVGALPLTNAYMGLSSFIGPVDPATAAAVVLAGELTVAGYARQAVSGWGAPLLDAFNAAYISAAPVTFLNTGGVDSPAIYTWFVIHQSNGKLIACGNYSPPITLPATVGTYTATPVVRLTGL